MDLNRRKRVFSFSKRSINGLSLNFKQSTVVASRKLTPVFLRRNGSYLVVLDELTKVMDFCGDLVSPRDLQLCKPRGCAIQGELPAAAKALFANAPKAAPTPAPAPAPAEEKPKPEKAKRRPKRKPKPKPAPAPVAVEEPAPEAPVVEEPVVAEEPEAPAADLNPFE